MGQDKALLPFCGVPLIEIAVAKLQVLCSEVSILGSRDDLSAFAPVVHDLRSGIGPGAAFETALRAASQPWVMLIPVDVPLVPSLLLEAWAIEIREESLCGTSFLTVEKKSQPVFCMLHRKCAVSISQALDRGDRKLNDLLYAAASNDVLPVCPKNVRRYAPNTTVSELDFWFSNINTPQELAHAEAWAQSEDWQPPSLGRVPY